MNWQEILVALDARAEGREDIATAMFADEDWPSKPEFRIRRVLHRPVFERDEVDDVIWVGGSRQMDEDEKRDHRLLTKQQWLAIEWLAWQSPFPEYTFRTANGDAIEGLEAWLPITFTVTAIDQNAGTITASGDPVEARVSAYNHLMANQPAPPYGLASGFASLIQREVNAAIASIDADLQRTSYFYPENHRPLINEDE